jgi:hypothetical protein
MINWSAVDKTEDEIIDRIASRACLEFGLRKFDLSMDITACHTTNPLKLDELLNADDENFAHDIFGIRENINRDTGELEDFFLPRYSK